MIRFGDYNILKVKREAAFGLYLDKETGNTSDDILLPTGNIVGDKPAVGDEVNVFIYRDSKDRLIATMKKPKVTVDHLSRPKSRLQILVHSWISVWKETSLSQTRK